MLGLSPSLVSRFLPLFILTFPYLRNLHARLASPRTLVDESTLSQRSFTNLSFASPERSVWTAAGVSVRNCLCKCHGASTLRRLTTKASCALPRRHGSIRLPVYLQSSPCGGGGEVLTQKSLYGLVLARFRCLRRLSERRPSLFLSALSCRFTSMRVFSRLL